MNSTETLHAVSYHCSLRLNVPENAEVGGKFRTQPTGLPAFWRWSYIGVLADHTLATEFGAPRLVSANISRARDGALMFMATPFPTSGIGDGCAAVELELLDPPRLRRTNAGALVVRARQTGGTGAGFHTGACTHDAGSLTGIITVASQSSNGLQAELRATGLRP